MDRDDLEDGGSNHFFEVINATRKNNPEYINRSFNSRFFKKRGCI